MDDTVNMPPKVAIILVNLNQEEHTRQCLQSLGQLTYQNLEIILIDNGSSDGSGAKIHKEFSTVLYKHIESNTGFAGGNNIGIRLALQGEADYVLLLNNDTIVDPDCIQPLVELDAANKDIGAQCGKIYFSSDPNKLWYAGGLYSVDKALSIHRGMHSVDNGQYNNVEETDFATGCMMFMGRSALEKVGFLDDSLFAYFEDVDWCLRARTLGYQIMYNPQSKIWHAISVTSKIDSASYLYLQMRNKILMVRNHGRSGRWLTLLPYFVYFYGRNILRMALRHRSALRTSAIITGLVDGLSRNPANHGKGHLDLFASQGNS